MHRFSILVVWMLFMASAAVAAADGQKKAEPKPKPKPQDKEEVLSFTTEDLERKFGKSAKARPKPDAKAKNAQDPLALLQAQQEAARQKVTQRAEAQKRVTAAETKVAELERRVASVRNPLLGRAQPGAEEEEAWKGADQAGRLRMAQESLTAAQNELADARKALKELR